MIRLTEKDIIDIEYEGCSESLAKRDPGQYDGNLRVRIAAPPVDGEANGELVRVLAKYFGVAKRSVEITAGHSFKTKQIRIDGVTAAQARKLIAG